MNAPIFNVSGVDYNVKDALVRGQVSTELSFTFSQYEGKYIDGYGDIRTDNSTHTSNPLQLPDGATELIVTDVPVANGINNIGFYTTSTPSKNTCVGVYAHSQSHASDIKIPVPAGTKYIMYSYLASTVKGSLYYFNAVNPSGTTFFENRNLFHITPATLCGRYYNSTNTLVVAQNYGQSELIPVVPTKKYVSSNTGFIVNWYDSSKQFLVSTSSSDYTTYGVVTAPSDAAYARFMFEMSEIETFGVYSVEDNGFSEKKEYIPYIDFLFANLSQFNGAKWASLGDSITARNIWQSVISKILNIDHTNCGIGSTSLSGSYVNGNTSLPSFWMPARLNAVKSADPALVTILGGANDVVHTGLTLGTAAEFGYDSPSDAMASEGAAAYSTSASYSVGAYCTKDGTRYQCTTAISGGEAWNASHWKPVKNVDSFLGAYSYIIENLLTWKHNLSIVILGTTWGENNGEGYAHGINYTMLSDASRQVAQYYGLPFADLHGLLGYNKFTMGTGANAVYSDDQIHPNIEGSRQFIKVVLNVFANEVTVH